jgi:hypothetical protein
VFTFVKSKTKIQYLKYEDKWFKMNKHRFLVITSSMSSNHYMVKKGWTKHFDVWFNYWYMIKKNSEINNMNNKDLHAMKFKG